jgi:hypothetical protein
LNMMSDRNTPPNFGDCADGCALFTFIKFHSTICVSCQNQVARRGAYEISPLYWHAPNVWDSRCDPRRRPFLAAQTPSTYVIRNKGAVYPDGAPHPPDGYCPAPVAARALRIYRRVVQKRPVDGDGRARLNLPDLYCPRLWECRMSTGVMATRCTSCRVATACQHRQFREQRAVNPYL